MEYDMICVLLLAFTLDFIFGDPRKLPHLIVGFGNWISFGEKKLNKGKYRFLKGALLTMLSVVGVGVLGVVSVSILSVFLGAFYKILFSTILLFYCLANKTLVTEGKAVFNVLHTEGLVEGRKRLSWIVGRDTTNLSAQQVRIATLETMSENLSDGVIAPLFYFVCFGVPGAVVYKMINTLDSMIGYKNERYLDFGKFAAKLDDVANYIPARITAFLILAVTNSWRGFSFVFSESKKHSSPNAGWPEAALACVLNCRFGGPNVYYGELVTKPYIGNNNRDILHEEIENVSHINYKVAIAFVLVGVLKFVVF